jgi:hypothetical protein
LVKQLEDLLAGATGGCPNEIAVDARCHLIADRSSAEQRSSDIAVGDGAHHARPFILGKQDTEFVGVESPKRFFDRFGFSDDKLALLWQRWCPRGRSPRFWADLPGNASIFGR